MTTTTPRLRSIDAFRGCTMALMILVNNPGSWGHIYPPLEHAIWHGVTPTDWVFPFFLFIVGVSLGITKHQLSKLSTNDYLSKVCRRTLILFGLGVLLNAFPFFKVEGEALAFKSLEHLRIMGVLQRIALCYLVSALLVRYTSIRAIIIFSVVSLCAYWAACVAWHIPTSGDMYSLEAYFGTSWDMRVFGETHLYHGEGVAFDPEGLASTLPAVVTTLFGFLAFTLFSRSKHNTPRLWMLLGGCVLAILFCVEVWNPFFPMNKKIWTSSYVVYTASLATIFLLLAHIWLDRTWGGSLGKKIADNISFFFNVFGRNAIFIYVLNGALVRIVGLIRWKSTTAVGGTAWKTPWSYLYADVFVPLFPDPRMASLCSALVMVGTMWLVAFWMYKRQIIVKV